MDSNTVQTLCSGGCGFYSSPATNGFCSFCYKKKQHQTPAVLPTPVPVSQTIPVSTATSATAQPTITQAKLTSPKKLQAVKDDQESAPAQASTSKETVEESADGKDTDKAGKKSKNRCTNCRKKVGLTGFECRCGGLFCSLHRYSDKHDCQFDYRGSAAEEIRRKNPVVVGEKVQKI